MPVTQPPTGATGHPTGPTTGPPHPRLELPASCWVDFAFAVAGHREWQRTMVLPAQVDTRVYSYAAGRPESTFAALEGLFLATARGGERVTLSMDKVDPSCTAFNATQVHVGIRNTQSGVVAMARMVSIGADGWSMTVQLPSYADVCGSAGCDLRPLTIRV